MKEFNYNQVAKALDNHGFAPNRSWGDEVFGFTYSFKKESDTGGAEFATVEECTEDGTCTIDGLNSVTWGERNI